uniref:CUB domain-containing protein n=1 Tax=Heterorhabditis bacteriophora TaxID=37862 RepID=A0A1I7X9A5_HETBA
MVLLITFVQFSDMSNTEAGSTDCTRTAGNLTLFDGPGDNSPVFSTFCGEASSPKAPIINEPITMTTSDAMLKFKGTKGSFTINWELKKRDCGYRTNLPEGSLLVPMHHLDTSCEWFISAPFDKFIEIDIPSVEMTSGDQLNCTINQLEVE